MAVLYVFNSPINSFNYLHNSASNFSNLAFTMWKAQGTRCQHLGFPNIHATHKTSSPPHTKLLKENISNVLETDQNIPIHWSETEVIILQHEPVSPATVYSWEDTWLRLNQMIPALGTWGQGLSLGASVTTYKTWTLFECYAVLCGPGGSARKEKYTFMEENQTEDTKEYSKLFIRTPVLWPISEAHWTL